MKAKRFAIYAAKLNVVLITALCVLCSMTANADWVNDSTAGLSMGDPQDIVVTLNSNPKTNPEAACLAVTFARMSKMGGMMMGVNVNVTLFPTLKGVPLGDKKVVTSRRHRNFKCSVPAMMDNIDGLVDGKISLEENLNMFLYGQPDTSELTEADILNGNNNMVICPLCWTERYDKMPDYGYLPPECIFDASGIILNPQCMAVMKMSLDADKVFDF